MSDEWQYGGCTRCTKAKMIPRRVVVALPPLSSVATAVAAPSATDKSAAAAARSLLQGQG